MKSRTVYEDSICFTETTMQIHSTQSQKRSLSDQIYERPDKRIRHKIYNDTVNLPPPLSPDSQRSTWHLPTGGLSPDYTTNKPSCKITVFNDSCAGLQQDCLLNFQETLLQPTIHLNSNPIYLLPSPSSCCTYYSINNKQSNEPADLNQFIPSRSFVKEPSIYLLNGLESDSGFMDLI